MAEGTTLAENLKLLTNPDTLESLHLKFDTIVVNVYRSDKPDRVEVQGLAPFHTIEDIQRAVWVDSGTPDDLFPKYTFFGIENDDGTIQPATFLWYETAKSDTPLSLLNPIQVITTSALQDTFVSSSGTKNPVGLTTRSRVTLQDAFLRHGSMPTFCLYSYSYLRRLYTGPGSSRDWNGLFYPFFPSLGEFQSSELSAQDGTYGDQIQVYINEKRSQIVNIETVLMQLGPKSLKTTDAQYISLKWIQQVPSFEGTDLLFYAAPVTELRPYMRLLPPTGTPLTKLYTKDKFSPPAVNDPVLLKTWVQDRAPISDQNCLYSKLVMRRARLGVFPLYATLLVFDDATAELVIQPPKERRVIDVQSELSELPIVLEETTLDMPFSVNTAQLHKANVSVQIEFDEVPPKDIRKQLAKRFEALSTLFQPTEVPKDMQQPLFFLKFKCISNFAQEDSITSFISYHFSRKGLEGIQNLSSALAKEFDITVDKAQDAIEKFMLSKTEQTVADPEAKDFVPSMPSAPTIAIVSSSVKTFKVHLFDIDSFEMFIEICTLLNAVIAGNEEVWDDILGTTRAPALEATAEVVESVEKLGAVEEAAVQQAAMPPDMNFPDVDGYNLPEDEEEVSPAAPTAAPKTKAAATVAPAPAAPAPANNGPQQQIVAHEWFIRRLKRLDPVLFEYKVDKGKGERHYTSQCQANDDRHPVVLTQEEYDNVRALYLQDEKEGKVGFIEYGTPNTKKSINEARGKKEQITALRYGSSLQKANWYICSEYFCLYDLVPLLAEEFEKTGHCRFCKGTLITNKHKPGPNERVFQRKVKPQSKKRHVFVHFLGKAKHPENFELPCCFVTRKDIDWSDAAFKHLKAPLTQTDIYTSEVANKAADDDASVATALVSRAQQLVNYEQLRYQLNKQYVVGPEKYPLEPGKIGLPNLALDTYLGQNGATMVERRAIMQTFRPTVHGFFRVGVMNKATLGNQSLFAALAPILGKNTSKDVEEFFLAALTPRIFVALNFGNLVLEFYNPNDAVPIQSELDAWAQTHLQINKSGTELEISRVWRAYHRFRAYISDPSQKKQLRHFVHWLAEPNLLTKYGLTLLTITYDGLPRDPSSTLHVSCPLLGYDFDRYASNSVAFITYYPSGGVWEPLLYIDTIKEKEMLTPKLEGYYKLSQGQLLSTSFPKDVQQRYLEFTTQCRSAYRGAATYQSGIDPRSLIPLSRMIELLKGVAIAGFVRDAYNHCIGITVRPKGSRTDEVLIPVADDGNTFSNAVDVRVHLGLQSIELATAEQVQQVYTEYVMPAATPLSSLYELTAFVRTNEIVAFKLGSEEASEQILLPCRDGKSSVSFPVLQISDDESFQFEYQINRELIVDRDDTNYPESEFILEKRFADDIFQHFRLSFSNWIASEDGAGARTFVDKLLARNDLPKYEKFRRMELELGSILESWLAPDEEEFTIEPVLLRKDCHAETDPAKCTGFCTVVEGQCKLHVPAKLQLNTSTEVPIRRFLTLRLFDEILRIPGKRQELLERKVRKIQVPSRNIHIDDHQWILPETSPAWYDLLRDDTDSKRYEKPVYWEEFSRSSETEDEIAARLQQLRYVPLPERIASLVSEEGQKRLAISIVGRPGEDHTKSLLDYFGISKQPTDSNEILSTSRLVEISRKAGTAVVQVLSQRPDIPPVGRTPVNYEKKMGSIVLIPDMPQGPGLVVLVDSGGIAIPTEYLLPALTDIIEYKVQQPRLVRVPKAAPAEAEAPKPAQERYIRTTQKVNNTVAAAPPAPPAPAEAANEYVPVLEQPAEPKPKRTIRWKIERPTTKAAQEAPPAPEAPKRPILTRVRKTVPQASSTKVNLDEGASS